VSTPDLLSDREDRALHVNFSPAPMPERPDGPPAADALATAQKLAAEKLGSK